jgi:nucleoid-associated protein YgaU
MQVMARETKIGLVLVLVLVSVFGALLYKRIKHPNEAIAAIYAAAKGGGDKTADPSQAPPKSDETAKEQPLLAAIPAKGTGPDADELALLDEFGSKPPAPNRTPIGDQAVAPKPNLPTMVDDSLDENPFADLEQKPEPKLDKGPSVSLAKATAATVDPFADDEPANTKSTEPRKPTTGNPVAELADLAMEGDPLSEPASISTPAAVAPTTDLARNPEPKPTPTLARQTPANDTFVDDEFPTEAASPRPVARGQTVAGADGVEMVFPSDDEPQEKMAARPPAKLEENFDELPELDVTQFSEVKGAAPKQGRETETRSPEPEFNGPIATTGTSTRSTGTSLGFGDDAESGEPQFAEPEPVRPSMIGMRSAGIAQTPQLRDDEIAADEEFAITQSFDEVTPVKGGGRKTAEPTAITTSSYVVQQSDNYWSISRRRYGNGRYHQALALHNKAIVPDPQSMRPGVRISTPPATELESLFPEAFPKLAAAQTPKNAGEAAEAGFFVDEEGNPMYRVGPSDTLSKIAQIHLGRSSRWVQLFELNKDRLKNEKELALGTVLKLPPDANQVRVMGKR